MHGSDAGLRSVAQQNQNEGQPHGRLIKLRGVSDKDGPVQPRQRVRSKGLMSGIVGQNRAEQGHREPNAPDDGVLPCSFERRFAPVEHDQEHGCQRGSFDRHPEYSKVVGKSDENHGKNKQRSKRVVFSQLIDSGPATQFFTFPKDSVTLVVTKIANSIDRTYQGHKSGQENDQRTQSVRVKESIPN